MNTVFRDRQDAGKQLAEALVSHKMTNVVILALPRGGMPVGYEIAHHFGLPLDIISVRKIGHPLNPEYAIGAVDEKGRILFDEEERNAAAKPWLREELIRQRNEAARRAILYRGGREKIKLAGKTAIIVDDGVATGLTVRLALKIARKEKAEKIIVAVPVCSREAASLLQREADELLTLLPPAQFTGAVGNHYEHFPQVSDNEVVRLIMKNSIQT
ncbi:MAG: phosphoribosyltransferase family protein [Minisyncoccia bacterium]|jgi:predicted phosphoribosyltransferase